MCDNLDLSSGHLPESRVRVIGACTVRRGPDGNGAAKRLAGWLPYSRKRTPWCTGYIARPLSKETVFTLDFLRCDPSFPAFLPGSRSLRENRGCPDHEGFSACFPCAIRLVSRRDLFSRALLLCVSQAVFPCAANYLVPSILNQEAKTSHVLLTIDNPIQYIVRLTSLPPFPVICPDTIRCETVLLCYAGCVPVTCSAHSLHRRKSEHNYAPSCLCCF
jgi:hypothetical protein